MESAKWHKFLKLADQCKNHLIQILCFCLIALHKKWKFSIKDFFSKCDQIHRKLDLVTFTEESLNGKLNFLCSVGYFALSNEVSLLKIINYTGWWLVSNCVLFFLWIGKVMALFHSSGKLQNDYKIKQLQNVQWYTQT